MQYLPASPGMLDIVGSPVRRVETYKILGVHLSSDLTWNVHIEYIMKKASKRLYALRSLKFISKATTTPPLSNILTKWYIINDGYQLRSGQQRYEQVKGHTERFNNFVTVRFQ